MSSYEFENEGTKGYALERARRHSVDEIAAGMRISVSYLAGIMQSDDDVGVLLLGKFCRDQGLTPRQVKRYE